MAPINFGLPGFFKANLSSVDCGWSVYVAPSITSNLQLHIQADHDVYINAGVTCAADTEAIAQVNDKSGNGNNLTQINASDKPLYVVDDLNGNNVLDFNSDVLDFDSDINLGTTFTSYHIYKKDSGTDSFALLGHNSNPSLIGDWAGNSFYVIDSSNSNIKQFQNFGDLLDYSIITVIADGSGVSLYENGLLHETKTPLSSDMIVNRIGKRDNNTGNDNAHVADMLLYSSSHSITDMNTTITELNSRYSIFPPFGGAPATPVISGSTLEHYLNPDYDVYSDMGKTLATNNDNIRIVREQVSGTTYQAAATNQLVFHDSVFSSGLKSIFNNSGDYMKMSEEITFTNSESFVVYSVHKRTTSGGQGIYFNQGSPNTAILDWNNGTCYFFDDNGTSTSVNAGWGTNTVIRAYVVDRTANLFRVYENGFELGTNSTTSLTGNVTFSGMFGWGAGTSGNGQTDFGNVLLYRGLHDATNVTTVNNWLNKKYNVHSYLTQQGGTLPVTSNLLLQIEGNAGVYSDQGVSPTVDSSNIREVTDFSSNNNDLDQSTAGSQLTYETNHFNRKDFVKHTANRFMSPTTSFNLAGGTVYVTGKKDLENSDWWFIGGDSNACMGNFSSGVMSLYDGTNYNTIDYAHLTQHAVYAIVWNFGGNYELYKNGVLVGSADVSNVGQINNVKVFGRGTETGASVNYFGDILVYSDVHNSTQIGQITDYLIDKTYTVDSYTQEPTYRKFLAHHFEAENSSLKTNNFVPTSGDTIDFVNDLTHNKVNGSVSGAKQVYHTDEVGINNKPYVQLSTGVMDLDKPIECERTQDWTIFAVVKKDSASDVLTLYGGDINTALFSDYSDNTMYFVSPTNHVTVPSMGTGWSIISAVYNGKDDTLKVYKNGTQLGTTQTFSISGPYTINRLFNRGNAVTTSGTGVAESMFYLTELSSAEITAETNRLNTKYDIY